MSARLVALLLLGGGLAAVAATQAPPGATSCVACHADPEIFEGEDLEIARRFADDVHAAAGLSCHDCHGGNPDPALFDDMGAAMDEGFAEHPYVGSPPRADIPGSCGRCHSDPVVMGRFAPDLRTDQEQEYWTSHHGRALREGNERVAVCVDCHGVHGILGADDPDSATHATQVAATCGACHSDPAHMAGAILADGRPLPVDQQALWRQSVHARALFEKEDLFAPTCNDCHGNHGATPPGLDSLAFVCGQCHGREAELFRASDKHDLLPDHQALMEGEESCASCHEAPEPQAELSGHVSFGECDTCHGHHAVVRPTLAMLSPLPETPCAFCHETATADGPAPIDGEGAGSAYEATRDQLLASAPADLGPERRFDWLVDRALALPQHSDAADGGERRPRAEFGRLFEKFRLGKIHFTYTDPATGAEAERAVVRCSRCHGTETVLGEPVGAEASAALLSRMRDLTALSASAERRLLRARRGGVETRRAQDEIDRAIDAQIELEVLVHAFSVAEDGPFLAKYEQGMEHARQALEASQDALDELSSRRTGLWISLGFIGLLLWGLAWKIRELR
ncbi:MAG TPA: hypothetical protein VMV46_18040 [Thermoanaerobaculia bacterium]|nr:hypothetical protein [Thermoanaerobaculia bacterium]